MIPRPEHDYKIHQDEKTVSEKKMELFKDCVTRINGLDGLSEFERRQLLRLDALAGTPMSIGYEVIPFQRSDSASTDTDSSEDSRCEPLTPYSVRSVSVKLMSDKSGYVDQREGKHLILESDGQSTYCVCENNRETEEGMEVVGTYTSLYDNISESESVNSRTSYTSENGLSWVNECNDNMLENIQLIYGMQVICPALSDGFK
jgi:hypothetical protein